MSWLSYCYKTYQNSVSEIGKQQPGKVPLLPVAHTTQQVNIEVELDKDGNFQYWEQQKTQNIACALVRGYYHRNKKVDYPMNVDETIKDRNYLFGRILACAEQIERRALIQLGNESEKRLTNAERLRTAFALHPAATTLLLDKKLNPYLNRMKNRNGMDSQRYAMMQELLHKIGTENFTNKRLGELYLVGYADQMMDFKAENAEYKAKAKKQEE